VINVRISGGLGNQLFQFGAASVLASHWKLPIKVWGGGTQQYATPRDFLLPQFVSLEQHHATVVSQATFVQRFRLAKLCPLAFGKTMLISDRNIGEALSRERAVQRVELDGYFVESIHQEFFERVVAQLAPDLRRIVRPAPDDAPVCAVHVRGGDFLTHGHTLADENLYYQRAIARVQEAAPAARLIVATDDRHHAKRVLERVDNLHWATGDLTDDFSLIAQAPYAVLSNSTFAFWARALHAPTSASLTIAPPYWRPGVRRQLRLASERDDG
jgi:hypothetical protein